MKLLKRAVVVLLVCCLLLAGVGTGAFLYLSRPEQVVPRAPLPDYAAYDLEAKIGWYELEPQRLALMTWGADGGLRMLHFGEEKFSARLVPVSAGEFRWLVSEGKGKSKGEEERRIEFLFDTDGNPRAFQWTGADGASHTARKVSEPGYLVRELAYQNGDLNLSGSLFLPRGAGPHPAAVMIHGSGDSDRDNFWYMRIVHHLVENGVALLLPDKRGCGKSAGEWRTAAFDDFAGDAVAAVEAVRASDGIAADRVGLLGISQGGWIASLAASKTPDVAFVINVSGATVTPNQQVRHEIRQDLTNDGVPRFLRGLIEPVAVRVPKRRRRVWWNQNGPFDPLPYWRELTVPALICYGRDDEQDNVPIARSVSLIEDLQQQKRNNAPLELELYEGSGHGLYEPGTTTIRGDFLDRLVHWIHEKTSNQQAE